MFKDVSFPFEYLNQKMQNKMFTQSAASAYSYLLLHIIRNPCPIGLLTKKTDFQLFYTQLYLRFKSVCSPSYFSIKLFYLWTAYCFRHNHYTSDLADSRTVVGLILTQTTQDKLTQVKYCQECWLGTDSGAIIVLISKSVTAFSWLSLFLHFT